MQRQFGIGPRPDCHCIGVSPRMHIQPVHQSGDVTLMTVPGYPSRALDALLGGEVPPR